MVFCYLNLPNALILHLKFQQNSEQEKQIKKESLIAFSKQEFFF